MLIRLPQRLYLTIPRTQTPPKKIPFCIWFVFTFAIFLFLVLEHLLALLLNPGGALALEVRPLVPLLLIFRTLAFSQRPCFPLCLCCPNICFSFRSYFYFCICKSKCSNKNTNATEEQNTQSKTPFWVPRICFSFRSEFYSIKNTNCTRGQGKT